MHAYFLRPSTTIISPLQCGSQQEDSTNFGSSYFGRNLLCSRSFYSRGFCSRSSSYFSSRSRRSRTSRRRRRRSKGGGKGDMRDGIKEGYGTYTYTYPDGTEYRVYPSNRDRSFSNYFNLLKRLCLKILG